MATKEQVQFIMEKLDEACPDDFFKRVNDTQAGIGAVLRLLSETPEAVTAGKISEVLNVSTARVAVLIKKLVSKGLITKEQDISDRRITVVKLTEYGKEMVCKIRNDLYEQTSRIIDTVGEERLLEFFNISKEIKAVISDRTLKF